MKKDSQSSFYITYIFSEHFSLEYSCIFSLEKNTYLSNEESLHLHQKGSFTGTSHEQL
jgi:hypothetical protein